ncbi:uncharacterized protein PHALS_14178 [Plasmopara halstedii]|uniref:Uncharacterized protein n=1 Tax=Plasmopara halstedii TaxID=4781 RepID=A0A0P1ARH9_PLAHL|nr:uncharacterized protein PHALS_14178 [Plasmopara halstedii]CEG43892.1 hypothetical protein PHALS_14178 [Plasmopara halstedii]|eukprot:XP_024580261.1 hypothetical protein PHALS_14178 [Plasmopara halstedii]
MNGPKSWGGLRWDAACNRSDMKAKYWILPQERTTQPHENPAIPLSSERTDVNKTEVHCTSDISRSAVTHTQKQRLSL